MFSQSQYAEISIVLSCLEENECGSYNDAKYLPEPSPEEVLRYQKMITNVKRNYMRAFDDCQQ